MLPCSKPPIYVNPLTQWSDLTNFDRNFAVFLFSNFSIFPRGFPMLLYPNYGRSDLYFPGTDGFPIAALNRGIFAIFVRQRQIACDQAGSIPSSLFCNLCTACAESPPNNFRFARFPNCVEMDVNRGCTGVIPILVRRRKCKLRKYVNLLY